MLKVFADRGGTFTDLVVVTDDQSIVDRLSHAPERFQITPLANRTWMIIYKLLSEQPERYQDAVIQGIRDVLGLAGNQPIPPGAVEVVKMGTTVATNALLEHKGEHTILLITQGFGDALAIGYQNRPHIFARQIILPDRVYERVIEVRERYTAQGEEIIPITYQEKQRLQTLLQKAYEDGMRAVAIAFMHGYRYPRHEQQVAALARQVGFTQVSVSHTVSPLMKLIRRGDTTVVDAYLSPILRRYVEQVSTALSQSATGTKLEFMKSDGGLTEASRFQGKDSILSGPAGGIVGAVKTSTSAGFSQIIGFDMGGTSTDVSHYNGEYERTLETEIAGVRMYVPMMSIHTVAAGGGSILRFDGDRYRVGPESAGANPGPACYRRGGPLTVTDCNVRLGKIQPQFFPQVFGSQGNLPIDDQVVMEKFAQLNAEIRAQTGDTRSDEEVAAGFLAIAIEKMANAIKKISIQRGYDVTQYTLCCFGGAGGQHACLIAEALGMKRIFIHPLAGVLSAYGIGLADVRILKERAIEAKLEESIMASLEQALVDLDGESRGEIIAQGVSPERIQTVPKIRLRYQGTDSALNVDFAKIDIMRSQFEQMYRQRYGFSFPDKDLIVEAAFVEAIAPAEPIPVPLPPHQRTTPLQSIASVQIYTKGTWHDTPVYRRQDLKVGDRITGAALILEATGTNVIEPGWCAEVTPQNYLILSKVEEITTIPSLPIATTTRPDPVMLEIFNNLFQSIAEEMGIVLQNTSYSVNIKERLDFSCAIFDQQGQLVANAPHIPVHLGSMGDSVGSLIRVKGSTMKPGDVFAANNPYNGGTHLPDITVITPVFLPGHTTPTFYVASRGHHADIGGITPGSMPPYSQSIDQEGILLDNRQIVDQGRFLEAELLEVLTNSPYPTRNPMQNLGDLQAQIAANERGVQELCRLVATYGLDTVQTYMQYIQDNAEASVRRAIEVLKPGKFTYQLDVDAPDAASLGNNRHICQICVEIQIDAATRSARIDFTSTSPQQPTNLNAPLAVCKAVVLYVFRTLVADDIPLNAGCLKPLEIIVPEGCLLNPRPPAAVVAGNVETSQAIANALYGALGVMAASQGTMNNFTFGNQHYQYYETICGGSGAGASFDGADAVHTHMTNSRLTDPEVLEWRFPVILEEFAIRTHSGGIGKYRGGNGVIRRLRFRETMTAAILSGHRIVPPFGLMGGQPGKTGRNLIVRSDGTEEILAGKAEVVVNPGDVFVIETPGGGGFGSVIVET